MDRGAGAATRWLGVSAEVVASVIACLAPWAIGAVDARSGLALMVGVAAMSLLGIAANWRSDRLRDILCMPSLALAGLALLATAQAIPLPAGLLRTIAPSEVALRADLTPAVPERVFGDDG